LPVRQASESAYYDAIAAEHFVRSEFTVASDCDVPSRDRLEQMLLIGVRELTKSRFPSVFARCVLSHFECGQRIVDR